MTLTNVNIVIMISEVIVEALVKPFANTISTYIKNRLQEEEYIDNMRSLLSANYMSRSRIKNMLHSSEPVQFMDIYCPLRIKKLATNNFNRSEETLEVSSVSDLMDTFNNVAIFGNAGSGKSTLVNFLYLDAIEKKYKYPILIYLRYLNDTEESLLDILEHQLLGFSKEQSNELFLSLLKEGHFLFIFDGYDEISPNKQYRVSRQIKDIMSLYSLNKFILTSRPLEQLYSLDSFHNYAMVPLTEKERNAFIKKQFSDIDHGMSEFIIKKLSENPNEYYDQLLNTPLLIILCILNFRFNSDMPLKKTEFYARIFDALFQGHDWLSKNGFERTMECNLTKDEYISILNEFSFYTHFKSQYFFKKQDVLNAIGYIKSRKGYNDKLWNIDNKKLLNDLSVAINILVVDGGYYTFPHKSFQEYYVANFIINKSEQNRIRIYEKFVQKIYQGQGSLLTQSLLSMLYEMDKKLFIGKFFLPLLLGFKENINNRSINAYMDESQLVHFLSMINSIIFGYDEYEYLRDLFSLGVITRHLDEIKKLISHIEHMQNALNDDDDFLLSEM